MKHERYVVRQDKFVVWQKMFYYLVFQLVAWHHLNACDIHLNLWQSTTYPSVTSNPYIIYHFLNIAQTGTFQYIHSKGIL